MGHYKSNLRDIEFTLFEMLGRDKVLGTGPYADMDVDTARTILSEVERLSSEVLAESLLDSDRNPPVFDPATHSVKLPESFKASYKAYEDAGYPNLGDISDYVPDYQFTAFTVRRDWLPAHTDPLRRFLAVVAKATQWLYDQPTDAVRVAEIVMKTTPEYAQRDYDHFRRHRSLDPTLRLSPVGMAKVIQVMTTAGTLVPGTVWQDRTDLSCLPAPTTTEGAPA